AMSLVMGRNEQLIDARRAFQQRVVRVHVQLDVRHVVEDRERHGRRWIARRHRTRGVRLDLLIELTAALTERLPRVVVRRVLERAHGPPPDGGVRARAYGSPYRPPVMSSR